MHCETNVITSTPVAWVLSYCTLTFCLNFMLFSLSSAVHSTKFSLDSLHVLSGSDDCTVRMWDIPSEKETFHTKEHEVL